MLKNEFLDMEKKSPNKKQYDATFFITVPAIDVDADDVDIDDSIDYDVVVVL
jgi:hypothetical protein